MRLITQAELLANATDVDGDRLTHQPGDHVAAGGTRRQRQRHLELHPGAQRRRHGELQLHGQRRHARPPPARATLDITPVNDAPVTTPVTLAAIAEDSGVRLITQAELLANATDVDGDR